MTTPTREQVVQWMSNCGICAGLDHYVQFATLARADLEATIEELRLQSITDFGQYQEAHERVAEQAKEIDRLNTLSVTNIIIAIVPGDGDGQEVYAKSVAEVESLLTKLSDKAEDYDLFTDPSRRHITKQEAEIERLRAALMEAREVLSLGCQVNAVHHTNGEVTIVAADIPPDAKKAISGIDEALKEKP